VRETSFPRQNARTRRFTLGVPRDMTISPDGSRVVFARSRSGNDPVNCLWSFDVATGEERLVVDPAQLLAGAAEELPPEERARRERARESSDGIVRYSTDHAVEHALFDLAGHLFVCKLESGRTSEVPTAGPAVDPRLDRSGTRIAYVCNEALYVVGTDGEGERVLLAPERGGISYGLAEFVAAEEMHRSEGYWWSPDGEHLLAARVDIGPVTRAYINDPANPQLKPVEVAYPFAGTDNAEVTLVIVPTSGEGDGVAVGWDRVTFEYLVRATWSEHGLYLVVESRDQRRMQIRSVDLSTGETTLVREDTDPIWLNIVTGLPALLEDGTLVWTAPQEGAQRLFVGDEPVTAPEMTLRSVLDTDGDRVLFTASTEPIEVGLFEWSAAGGLQEIVPPGDDDRRAAVRDGRAAGGTTVVREHSLDRHGTTVAILREGAETRFIESLEETPVLTPNLTLLRTGPTELRTALLLPTGHEPGSAKLPVLLDPYGGPAAQRVLAARAAFLTSQWFADQGFAVVVADGRGTPGRGTEWSRSIYLDRGGAVLDDQITALEGSADACPDLDLSRVAIRGWSYGGYLAALAILRRPDVFHVAVAGAPVTDMALYDTHYTERYMGTPQGEPEAYEQASLLPDAPNLSRPLMLIHGLADDNVLVANTLQLSALLTAAGRPHTVLPLVGVTHMTPQEEVAENLLLLQLRFMQDAFAAMDHAEGR
jgi:dipeptidyl-peptidase 4